MLSLAMNNLTLCLKNYKLKLLIIEVIKRKLFQHLLTWIKRSSPQIKLAPERLTDKRTDERTDEQSHWWTHKARSTLLLLLIKNIYIVYISIVYSRRNMPTDTQKARRADRQTDKQRDRPKDRPRDRWTDRHTHRRTRDIQIYLYYTLYIKYRKSLKVLRWLANIWIKCK